VFVPVAALLALYPGLTIPSEPLNQQLLEVEVGAMARTCGLQAQEQQKRFDERFGKRIRRLESADLRLHGPQAAAPRVDTLGLCTHYSGPALKKLDKALDDVEPELRRLEREFGGY
jgi:hypothetical protein